MSFFFIGGSQRSGTTVLQKFLCKDATATPKLAEASYLRVLVDAYAQGLADFEHDTQSYFSNVQDFKHFNACIVQMFLNRTIAQFPDSTSLILKEPHLTQLFPQLFELVPTAQFIMIMRDPRDIISSMVDVGRRMQEQGQQHFFQQRNMEQLSNYLKSFYAPTLNNKNAEYRNRCLTIRYEDLMMNTEQVRQNLSSFTGLALNFSENASFGPEVKQDAAEHQSRYLPWITDNNQKDMNSSSIGRYQAVLTGTEIEQVNQHCADVLHMFQYS